MNIEENVGAANFGAIVVIISIILGGIVFTLTRDGADTLQNTGNNNVENNENNRGNQQQTMSNVEVVLTAQNNSGQNGKVTLSDENGKTKVVINIAPGPKGVAQPAHIHDGDCTKLGAIKYNLNDIIDGHSETILTPALHFIHGLGQTAINFHKSRAEIGVYSGCGNLLEALNNAARQDSSGSVQGTIKNEGELKIK